MKAREFLDRLGAKGPDVAMSWPSPAARATLVTGFREMASIEFGESSEEAADPKVVEKARYWLQGSDVPEMESPRFLAKVARLLGVDPMFEVDASVAKLVQHLKRHPDGRYFGSLLWYHLNREADSVRTGVGNLLERMVDDRGLVSVPLDAARAHRSLYLGSSDSPIGKGPGAPIGFQAWQEEYEIPLRFQGALRFQLLWTAQLCRWSSIVDVQAELFLKESEAWSSSELKNIVRCAVVLATKGQKHRERIAQQALVTLGDPTDDSRWGFCALPPFLVYAPIMEECRRTLRIIAIKSVLDFFFQSMAQDFRDKSRLRFWSEFLEKIQTIDLVSDDSIRRDVLRKVPADQVYVRQFIESRMHVTSKTSTAAALVLGFGPTVIVEFTETGNATFVYQRAGVLSNKSEFPPKRIGSVQDLKYFDQTVNINSNPRATEGRMIHAGAWQSRFRHILRYRLGV